VERPSGRVRLVAFVDDTASPPENKFKTALLNDTIALNIKDAGQFDASVALTGCSPRSDRVVRCRSSDGHTRATVKTLRDDPNIFTLSVLRRRLDLSQTGNVQPTAPVTATLQQGDIEREGTIGNKCRQRGTFSLSCRMP
jgi:hypothetical protein